MKKIILSSVLLIGVLTPITQAEMNAPTTTLEIKNENGFKEFSEEVTIFEKEKGATMNLQEYMKNVPAFQEKKMTFIDVKASDWFKNDVEFGNKMGILTGKNKKETFLPNDKLTRAEVAAVLTRNLTSHSLTYSTSVVPKDLDKAHWGYNAIVFGAEKEYLKGYEDGTFQPDKNVTRAEFISMIDRSFKNNVVSEFSKVLGEIEKNKDKPIGFKDVSKGQWFYQSIKDMTHILNLSGYEDGTFRPDQEITRAEMAVIVNRYYDFVYKNTSFKTW